MAERQTRKSQKLLPVMGCGFDSHHGHMYLFDPALIDDTSITCFFVNKIHLPWSNFFHSLFVGRTPDGGTAVFDDVERYFQAWKAKDPVDFHKVRNAETPGLAKRIGRGIGLRSDWEQIKLGVMREALQYKFADGSDLARQLVDTNDRLLVEGNWWGDKFWGVDLKDNYKGHNWLGTLLMARRAELRTDDIRLFRDS